MSKNIFLAALLKAAAGDRVGSAQIPLSGDQGLKFKVDVALYGDDYKVLLNTADGTSGNENGGSGDSFPIYGDGPDYWQWWGQEYDRGDPNLMYGYQDGVSPYGPIGWSLDQALTNDINPSNLKDGLFWVEGQNFIFPEYYTDGTGATVPLAEAVRYVKVTMAAFDDSGVDASEWRAMRMDQSGSRTWDANGEDNTWEFPMQYWDSGNDPSDNFYHDDSDTTYPVFYYEGKQGDVYPPLHISGIPFDPNNGFTDWAHVAIMISFRSGQPVAGPDSNCDPNNEHCCHITKDDEESLWEYGKQDDNNNCYIIPPQYRCYANGDDYQSAGWVNQIVYTSSLYDMQDGGNINIEIDPGVRFPLPVSNIYNSYIVQATNECYALCDMLTGNANIPDNFDELAAQCNPDFDSWLQDFNPYGGDWLKGDDWTDHAVGDVNINGYGRITSYPLLDVDTNPFGQPIYYDYNKLNDGSGKTQWAQWGPSSSCCDEDGWCPGFSVHFGNDDDLRNCFTGGTGIENWAGCTDIGDACFYKWREYRLHQQALHFSGEQTGTINVSGITVEWPGKAGGSAVAFYNGPSVNFYDFKLMGAWTDASDGPEMHTENSSAKYVFYHVNDDTIKPANNHIYIQDATVIGGGSGSSVLMGDWGYPGTMEDVTVSNVWIHRKDYGSYDDLAALVTLNVCPKNDGGMGVTQKNITIENVFYPALQDNMNQAPNAFSIGTLASDSTWCGEDPPAPALFYDIHLENWNIYSGDGEFEIVAMETLHPDIGQTWFKDITVENVNRHRPDGSMETLDQSDLLDEFWVHFDAGSMDEVIGQCGNDLGDC